MKNLDLITSKVYGELSENSMMVYYSIDLNDIPPFMSSPFTDGWFWANNTNDLIKYVFEILIANYFINDVMAFRDFNNIGNKDYDFIEAFNIYKKYKNMNEKREQALNRILSLYEENINKELSYKELIKLFYELEEYLPYTGIEIVLESYLCPLETRHSKNLKEEKFNNRNLIENY